MRSLKEKQAVSLTKKVDSPSALGQINGTLTCQIPTKELSVFQGIFAVKPEDGGNDLEESVDSKNLLLRGSILKNSNWVAGMVVYTGRLTKLSLNMNISKFKFSGIETSLNSFVPKVLFLQLALTLVRELAFLINVDLLQLRAILRSSRDRNGVERIDSAGL